MLQGLDGGNGCSQVIKKLKLFLQVDAKKLDEERYKNTLMMNSMLKCWKPKQICFPGKILPKWKGL